MTTAIRRIAVAASSALALLAATHSNAGVFRTYLSELGADTNPCTLPSPCRLLPAALAAVNDGGEVWILDSANFNTATVNVTKSVTILAVPGAVGSVVANGGDAMAISGSGINVALRNLVFVNLSGASNAGVAYFQGATLTVRDSSFTGLTNAGIMINSLGTKAQIIDSTFNTNFTGVRVLNGRASLINNNFNNNTTAIEAFGNGGASLSPPSGTTMVRVSGGTILDNATVFHMDGAGTRVSGGCNGANIFLGTSNIIGYTTYVSVTGSSDINNLCPASQYSAGFYNSPAQ